MDHQRQDLNIYRIASAPKPPPKPRAPIQIPPMPGAWPLQDQRLPQPRSHAQTPPPPPPPKDSGSSQSRLMPEPSHSPQHWWSHAPSLTHTSYSSYVHPTQSSNGRRPNEHWQFPEPQINRSVSHNASLQPPPGPSRPRSRSSTGLHPPLETSVSSPNLKHKYSHSDGGAQGWYEDENLNDQFEVSAVRKMILSHPTITFCALRFVVF